MPRELVPVTKRVTLKTKEPAELRDQAFKLLSKLEPEIEWVANLENDNTERAYTGAVAPQTE